MLKVLTIIFILVLLLIVLDVFSIRRLKYFYEHPCIDYSMVYSIKPDPVEENIDRGVTFAKQKSFNNAILEYSKGININPNYAVGYYLRGDSYARQDNYFQAIVDYTRASLLYILSQDKYPIGRCAVD